MKLQTLLTSIPAYRTSQDLSGEITNIEQDSRKVVSGTLFICIDGEIVDGHQFAKQAEANGAAAILAEKEIDVSIPVVYVKDSKRAMAILADRFYGSPSQKMKMIGVTGTNGKTTVTHLVEQIVRDAGSETGLIGTMYRKIGREILETKNTTPDSLTLQRTYHEMLAAGVQTVAMEVSSHALVQGRTYGTDFDIAVFTNLSQDHLDYHKTMEEYAYAKSLLFAQLGNSYDSEKPKYAIINQDDPVSQRMKTATAAPVITYGIDKPADFGATDVMVTSSGTTFKLHTPDGDFDVRIKMIGKFSIYNCLAALATSYALEIPIQQAITSLEKVQGVAGRFEIVDAGQDFTVIVDYAHTPDGLLKVLETIEEFKRSRVFAIVGCGGDRDKGKRPQMAKIAIDYATDPVFTSDNPRSEDPEAIIQDMLAGLPANAVYQVRTDRKEAITYAVNEAQAGDVILIAGKGHETYQIIGDQVLDFDDRAVAREAIEKKGRLA